MRKEDEPKQEINILLGSCPNCGKGVWSSDEVTKAQLAFDRAVYRCIQCGKLWKDNELIPF